ncbi:uncharacterized protein OCT59_021341 [Rhizophagus irregularis]|uniref:uncharacterized protein n=1 Tax=Rhizophagus irregularis TaxID=588596 RepID=UPI0033204586|nr:hypothetical protein OCT59_021341 [Rhizophagus irregularis]
MNEFIIENNLKWIPYNKFKNVKNLNKGGFGIIYKANWLSDNGNKEVILKCHNYSNENINEYLIEWKYHLSCLGSNNVINLYGFTEDPNTLKYLAVMDYSNEGNLRENLTTIIKVGWNQKLYMLYQIMSGLCLIHEQNLIHCDFHDDLMKKCWNEDPLERPSSKEVLDIIGKWIFLPYGNTISEELKCNVMEFVNATIGHNNLVTESHPQACYTSRLLGFTSKKLNEILESKDSQTSVKANEMLVSEAEDLNDYIIKDLGSLDEN